MRLPACHTSCDNKLSSRSAATNFHKLINMTCGIRQCVERILEYDLTGNPLFFKGFFQLSALL